MWKERKFSRLMDESKVCVRRCVFAWRLIQFSCVWLFETLWTVAHQAPLSCPALLQGIFPTQGSHLCLLERKKERKKKKLAAVMSNSATPWIVTCQAPLFMEFSRQEYWRELPFPSAGDLPDPGTEPRSPSLQADFLLFEPPGKPRVMSLRSFALAGFFTTSTA